MQRLDGSGRGATAEFWEGIKNIDLQIPRFQMGTAAANKK